MGLLHETLKSLAVRNKACIDDTLKPVQSSAGDLQIDQPQNHLGELLHGTCPGPNRSTMHQIAVGATPASDQHQNLTRSASTELLAWATVQWGASPSGLFAIKVPFLQA